MDTEIKDENIKIKISPIRLRRERQKKGWTLAEAASKLGVSPTSVHFWETGQKNPTRKNVQQILTVYEVEFEDITDDDNRLMVLNLRALAKDIMSDEEMSVQEKSEAYFPIVRYFAPDPNIELDDDAGGKTLTDIFKNRFSKKKND